MHSCCQDRTTQLHSQSEPSLHHSPRQSCRQDQLANLNKSLSRRTAVASTAHVIGSTNATSSSSSTGTFTTDLTTVATAAKVIGATHTTASVGAYLARVATAAKVVGAANITCCKEVQKSVCCWKVSLQLLLSYS